jgi:Transposase DDE domain
MRSIATVLKEFKEHWKQQFDPQLVQSICADLGHRWRDRTLTPGTTLAVFLLQVLHGNTACTHLPHLTDIDFSASAYCQARARLPLEVFRRLVSSLVAAFRGMVAGEELWHGHRLWIADGSSFSMPDSPELQQHFGQSGAQRPGCGFPMASILALFQASTGLLTQVLARPLRVHDMSGVEHLHAQLQAGDVLLGDTGLSSYVHFALLLQRGVFALFPVHQRQIVSFRTGRAHAQQYPKGRRTGRPTSVFVKKFSRYDQWVDYLKPKQRPRWMTAEAYAELPDRLRVREFRFWTHRRGYRTRCLTIATTLLDPRRYPLRELAWVYGQRWQVETNLKHIKITLGMDVLHTKTVDGVCKELTMFVLAYNLVRMAMMEAAERQQVPVDRISFVDTLRWLLSDEHLDALKHIVVNPSRKGRFEPRVKKRRPKPYPLMTRPREELRKHLCTQGVAS